VSWEVEYTDQFGEWWDALTTEEQRRTEAAVEVLQERGPGLGRPSRRCPWPTSCTTNICANCVTKEPSREPEDQELP